MSYLTKIKLAFKTIKNFPVFLLDYFGFLHRDVTYGIRTTGQKMIARGGTPDCKEMIVTMSGYEYPLGRLPQIQNPVIFDVGGHIGSFSLFAFNFYRTCEPRIFAFEPDKESFQILQKNLQLNGISSEQITVYPCALADYEGTGKLDQSKANDAYALSDDPKGRFEICAVKTLPGVAREIGVETIHILKLNIEGGEYLLLKHEPTFNFIKDHVIFIFLKYHLVGGENNEQWILKRLHDSFDLMFQREDLLLFKNKMG